MSRACVASLRKESKRANVWEMSRRVKYCLGVTSPSGHTLLGEAAVADHALGVAFEESGKDGV